MATSTFVQTEREFQSLHFGSRESLVSLMIGYNGYLGLLPSHDGLDNDGHTLLILPDMNDLRGMD